MALAIDKHLKNSFWRFALVLAVATFIAYQPVWRAGFIWDDDDHLTANPAMTAPHGLQMIWSSLSVSRYYPLTLTSFWIQRHLWGLNPMPYHLVNVALHVINGILIFLLLRRLRIPAPWLAAALWVLHPVNVESVAWITELKNTQSGIFFFLALLCFLRFEAEGKRRWYLLALLCGLAALVSKPSTVVLPLALLLCVWWEKGRWRWIDLLQTIPFFALALGMSAITVIEQRGHVIGAGTPEWNLSMAERLAIAGKAVWFYAAKLVWPVPLSFIYSRWPVGTTSFSSWIPLLGLVAVGILLWVRRRSSWARAAIFGLGFFVAALLPILGFFDVFFFRFSFVADHFQYLASIGLIALVVAGGAKVCQRIGPQGRRIGEVAAATSVMVLASLTWTRAHVYRDAETLWRDTLAKNPECWEGHNNLARVLLQTGRGREAVWHCEQVLRLMPNDFEAPYMLGIALLGLGDAREAIRCLEMAIRFAPSLTDAHNRLGAALLRLNRVPEAIRQFKLAVWIRPDWALMQNNLGYALARAGRFDEAIKHYQLALRIEPNSAEAYNNLALALLGIGKVQEAIGQYQQALRIKPDYPEVHNNLGLALFQLGDVPKAIEQFDQALRIKPDFIDGQRNLAWLLATLPPAEGGDPARAITLAEQACEFTGHRVPAYLDTLAAAYASAGRFNDAVAAAEKAIEQARSAGQLRLVSEIEARLELYRSGRPYRQTRTPIQNQPADPSRSGR